MKTTKILAVLLAMVLCLGILAGCQETPLPSESTKPTEAKPAETTAPVETEPAAYSFEGKKLDINSAHDLNDLPLDTFIEEALGLEIEWRTPSDEQISAMMTDKVTPSLLFRYGPSEGHEMGRYGAYVNLYDWYDQMPNFFARYEAYGEQIKMDYETGEGELYSAPVFLNGDVQHYGWMYREDIFEANNLKVPTTWQELLDVCEALKQAYPDCYPFTFRAMTGSMSGLSDMARQFGADVRTTAPSLDAKTNTFYNAWGTEEARNMLKMMRSLIDKGYADVASLSYSTSGWIEAMASGKSFITYGKAFHLNNIESAGKEANENFSINWWHNLPLVESDIPYECHATRDYMNYSWSITSKCPDVELAVRYLDWLYSDEGSLILSWGVEGKSFGVDENGEKYFLEDYDATFQGRYQDSGYIDMKATAAAYSPKTQEMIFDTMAVSTEGGYYEPPTPNFTTAEQKIIDTYHVDWYNVKNAYYQKFLLGELSLEDDAVWAAFNSEMAAFGEEQILQSYTDAYARYLNGEK